jgi:hypothetical protein
VDHERRVKLIACDDRAGVPRRRRRYGELRVDDDEIATSPLAAAFDEDISPLACVPVVDLTVIGVGVPAVAAAAAWLLAGRQPRSPTHDRLDLPRGGGP